MNRINIRGPEDLDALVHGSMDTVELLMPGCIVLNVRLPVCQVHPPDYASNAWKDAFVELALRFSNVTGMKNVSCESGERRELESWTGEDILDFTIDQGYCRFGSLRNRLEFSYGSLSIS